MAKPLLASDRVILLLSLVPYLREHGPTPVETLARVFEVDPKLLRRLVGFLGTAGIPGETLAYQHDDLFDIDWDLFEGEDVVALTHTVAVDDTPRFTGTETAAILAGLHALTAMLEGSDAEIARNLAARLAAAMGGGSTTAVSVSESPRDERLARLIGAIEEASTVRFDYRDAAGAASSRTVDPLSLSERGGVWYLRGYSHERGAERTFRVDQCSSIEVLGPCSARHDADADAGTAWRRGRGGERSEWIVAEAPSRLLPALRGFAPEVLEELGEESGARGGAGGMGGGRVRLRIEAWHAGAAVRLAQHGPGEIEIIAPAQAREAVREWSERALEAYSD